MFSPDVILCDWLGSKHQLTNFYFILHPHKWNLAVTIWWGPPELKDKISVSTLLPCPVIAVDTPHPPNMVMSSRVGSGHMRVPPRGVMKFQGIQGTTASRVRSHEIPCNCPSQRSRSQVIRCRQIMAEERCSGLAIAAWATAVIGHLGVGSSLQPRAACGHLAVTRWPAGVLCRSGLHANSKEKKKDFAVHCSWTGPTVVNTVCLVEFTEQTGQFRLTAFRKCWTSYNSLTEWMLLFRNIGNCQGKAAGCHCNNTSFISMFFSFFLSFSLSFSLSLCSFVFFLSSTQGNSYNMDGISYYLLYRHFHAGREKF